jgi:serine/threonine protein kinase
LGILLYEMLHGYAPFRGDLLSDVKNRMKVGAYNISSSVSKECKDLIISILKFEPEERVTLAEIEDHEWTIGIEKFMLSNFGENEYYNINSIHETKPNPNKLENYVNFNKDRKNSKNIHYRNHTQLSQHSSSPFLNVCDFANFDSSTEKLLPYK